MSVKEFLFRGDIGERVDGAIEFAVCEMLGSGKLDKAAFDPKTAPYEITCTVHGQSVSLRDIADSLLRGLERGMDERANAQAREMVAAALNLPCLVEFSDKVDELHRAGRRLTDEVMEQLGNPSFQLAEKEVQWVVDEDGDIGVRIRGDVFGLHKGESSRRLGPLKIRPVNKHEFSDLKSSQAAEPGFLSRGDWETHEVKEKA